MLIDRDIDALVAGDWELVRGDFDPDNFVGYDGSDPIRLRIAFATLDRYTERWFKSATTLRGVDRQLLRAQLRASQRIESVDFNGDHCVARKVFDGSVETARGSVTLDWTDQLLPPPGRSLMENRGIRRLSTDTARTRFANHLASAVPARDGRSLGMKVELEMWAAP